MDPNIVTALLPAFAAGFAVQRLLEILDPLANRWGKSKGYYLGFVSLAVGLLFAWLANLRVLSHLIADEKAKPPDPLDLLISALIISAGTEGINSILKLLSYKKEEKKEEATTQTVEAATAREIFRNQFARNFSLTAEGAAALAAFSPTGDLSADLTTALKEEMKSRFPDQFKDDGWDERKFGQYVSLLQIGKMYDAALSASDTVARAYGKQLTNQARLRIQNKVTTDSNPKKLLPVMENEVISA